MEYNEQVNKSDSSLDILFLRLYKEAFPTVARYIAHRGGDLEEARDVFQEALVVYYERVLANRANIKQSEKAYLFGIARHIWLHRFHSEKDKIPLADGMELPEEQEKQLSDTRLLQLLTQAGEKCMQLLKAFYYDKLNMRGLARQFGFSSERSATVQKFKCLEKIRNFTKENKLQYDDFME